MIPAMPRAMRRSVVVLLACGCILLAAPSSSVMAKEISNDPELAENLPSIQARAGDLRDALASERHPADDPAVETAPHLLLWRGRIIGETFTSPIYNVEPFDRAVLSWNAKGTATFEIGVGGRWFTMGKWGDEPRSVKANEVDVDTLKLDSPATALQFRVTPEDGAVVSLVAATFWGKNDHGTLTNERSPAWGKAPIDVPKRSQFNARTCSPTSVSMVLQFYGFNKPTPEVADGVYDHQADIYGNWPFNAAYAFKIGGMESYVRRMTSLGDIEAIIHEGRPAIISVKGPPLFSGEGHLIVVVGFAKNGDVIVNDPARSAKVRRTYKRADLFKGWMANGSGIAYVIRGPVR